MKTNDLAPIILFVYNRPTHTEQTLMALMQNELASDSILYIYSDGPKDQATENDIKKITDVRKVIRKKQWCKEVYIVESDRNKGLAKSIIEGVTEVIAKHDKVIVLEDDLLTSSYFLKYMNEALIYYENFMGVFSISANRPPLSKMQIPDDYDYDVFACLRSYSTGWATWENRWKKIDWTLDYLDSFMNQPYQIQSFNRSGEDMTKLLLMQRDGLIDSWSIRFSYTHFKEHAVAILPCTSYIDNIGFDGSGTHTNAIEDTYHNDVTLTKRDIKFLDIIYEDTRIINSFYSYYYPHKRPLWQKIINRISRIMGGKNIFTIKKKVYA